jgi:predicted nucleotidyltransferase component of viral defense system
MSIFEKHEQLEMIVLDGLRRRRLLDHVVFGGGTMLRLCHQMSRYSVDLDFYPKDAARDFRPDFAKMTAAVAEMGLTVTDAAEKHFSWLLEMRSAKYPRRLKIEIRKDDERAREREVGIAFSRFRTDIQVRLTVCSLSQMWANKVDALCDRREIRDAYDLEFLLRRGAGDFVALDRSVVNEINKILDSFSIRDFRSKLGNVLTPDERKRLSKGSFALLEGAMAQAYADLETSK